MGNVTTRVAAVSDAARIRDIYSFYVTDAAASFELEVPSLEEMQSRIAETLKTHPFIVAERDGEVVGYACAGPFRERPAYTSSAESSIYVDKKHVHEGIGRILMETLERMLYWQNIRLVCACIAYSDKIDEHITDDSVMFHRRMGYMEVGRFKSCANKFGSWYGIVWMTKSLYSDNTEPRPFIPFRNLSYKL